jgi:hypothetical protein
MTATSSNVLASDEHYRQPAYTSSSVSAFGLAIGDILRHGLVQPKPVPTVSKPTVGQSLDEVLFQALANAKIWTSQVAMRLDNESRNRYFKQLDRLHNVNEWFEEDKPVNLESYKGFIRFMLIVQGNSKPAMALSSKGQLVAVWETGGRKLVVEFIDSNRLQWLVNCGADDRTAGKADLENIVERLKPYSPRLWFDVA